MILLFCAGACFVLPAVLLPLRVYFEMPSGFRRFALPSAVPGQEFTGADYGLCFGILAVILFGFILLPENLIKRKKIIRTALNPQDTMSGF